MDILSIDYLELVFEEFPEYIKIQVNQIYPYHIMYERDSEGYYLTTYQRIACAMGLQSILENKKETILCAAIWYSDLPIARLLPTNVTSGVVICGHRHPHCIYTINAVTGKKQHELQPWVQGFLTNLNRFVDRKEAAQIAFAAGQIKHEQITLFSEDIY